MALGVLPLSTVTHRSYALLDFWTLPNVHCNFFTTYHLNLSENLSDLGKSVGASIRGAYYFEKSRKLRNDDSLYCVLSG